MNDFKIKIEIRLTTAEELASGKLPNALVIGETIKYLTNKEVLELKKDILRFQSELSQFALEMVNNSVCPECGYPKFKFSHEEFERCHGCNWTSE